MRGVQDWFLIGGAVNPRLISISLLAAAVVGCHSNARLKIAAEDLSERLSSIFAAAADGADPAVRFSTVERRWRYAIGAPKCREDWGNPYYGRNVRYDVARSVAFEVGLPEGELGASVIGVDPQEFESAVTAVMTAEGFRESELIFVTVCSRAMCNGESYCRSPNRREFYRSRDGLVATTAINDRNYPDVGFLFVQKARANHPCVNRANAETACHEPGRPPR